MKRVCAASHSLRNDWKAWSTAAARDARRTGEPSSDVSSSTNTFRIGRSPLNGWIVRKPRAREAYSVSSTQARATADAFVVDLECRRPGELISPRLENDHVEPDLFEFLLELSQRASTERAGSGLMMAGMFNQDFDHRQRRHP